MFKVFQYHPHESINHPYRGRTLVAQGLATREKAMETVENRLSHGFDVTGYNAEQDYYWGRAHSTSGPRAIFRIES